MSRGAKNEQQGSDRATQLESPADRQHGVGDDTVSSRRCIIIYPPWNGA